MNGGLFDKAVSSIQSIKADLVPQAYRILAELQDEIVRLNTQEQLFKGKDATGQKITPKYKRRRYAVAKNRMNPQPGMGTPDFKVTGAFYKGFYVKPIKDDKGSFEMDSSDDKTPFLVGRSGEKIFGLTTDNEGKINQETEERLLEWIISQINI